MPGPQRGIWNGQALAEHTELIVCESLIDAMTFWSAGYRNVTAAYGTNGFTAELEAALVAGASRVLIAFDRDEADERPAKKVAGRLMSEGVECYRILFPRGLDANAYALEVRPAAKSLGIAIRAATWMGSGPPPEGSAGSVSQSRGDAPEPAQAREPLP